MCTLSANIGVGGYEIYSRQISREGDMKFIYKKLDEGNAKFLVRHAAGMHNSCGKIYENPFLPGLYSQDVELGYRYTQEDTLTVSWKGIFPCVWWYKQTVNVCCTGQGYMQEDTLTIHLYYRTHTKTHF